MKTVIVSNNEITLENAPYPCIPVEGDTVDVLVTARDLIHQGYKLLSYPLGASFKMLHSPSNSVLLEEREGPIDPISLEIIENSMQILKKIRGEREADERHRSDYEVIDWNRLQSAMNELKK